MLDNCLKACIANPSSENFIHIAIATTENDKFTIHCENTTAEEHPGAHTCQPAKFPLSRIWSHQYPNTAEKYHGFFTYSVETLFYMDLMIPIIEKANALCSNLTHRVSSHRPAGIPARSPLLPGSSLIAPAPSVRCFPSP